MWRIVHTFAMYALQRSRSPVWVTHMLYDQTLDVIVVGGCQAGAEPALATDEMDNLLRTILHCDMQ